MHASDELTTVIDGEALVDDGIAAVLYAVFLVRESCSVAFFGDCKQSNSSRLNAVRLLQNNMLLQLQLCACKLVVLLLLGMLQCTLPSCL